MAPIDFPASEYNHSIEISWVGSLLVHEKNSISEDMNNMTMFFIWAPFKFYCNNKRQTKIKNLK